MLTGWRLAVSRCFLIPHRVIFAIMGFFAIFNAYTMRICLSVAIVDMVHKTNKTDLSSNYCARNDTYIGLLESHEHSGQYDWSESTQGFILSSFYVGYIITHIPGGYLSEKFGGKWILSLGILSTAIFTLLTPIITMKYGALGLIILRVLMGAGEGTTFPALSALLSSWVPLQERGILGSLVLGGGQIGTVVGNALSGYLISLFDSWKAVFYFFGLLAILWFIIFTLICYNNPQEHPFITDREREYLNEAVSKTEKRKDLREVPWRYIARNVPLLALLCAQIGHDWGFFIMVTDLPKYMHDILDFSITNNGLLSSIPFIFMWIVSISSGFLVDYLIVKEKMTVTFSRKFFTTFAAIGPAIFMLLASYAGCDRVMVVIYFVISMALMGPYYPSMKVNILDLSPNYAGIIMAVINGLGAITGVIAPTAVGLLTPNTTLEEWRVVFWITFFIFLITSLIYILGASGEIQDFDDPEKIKAKELSRK